MYITLATLTTNLRSSFHLIARTSELDPNLNPECLMPALALLPTTSLLPSAQEACIYVKLKPFVVCGSVGPSSVCCIRCGQSERDNLKQLHLHPSLLGRQSMGNTVGEESTFRSQIYFSLEPRETQAILHSSEHTVSC